MFRAASGREPGAALFRWLEVMTHGEMEASQSQVAGTSSQVQTTKSESGDRSVLAITPAVELKVHGDRGREPRI